MKKIELPYFEEINLKNDFFETEYTNSKGNNITISIDFEGEKATEFNFEPIQSFLNNIENNIDQIKNRLLKSTFSQQVNEYAEHHMIELKSELKIKKNHSMEDFVNLMHPSSINIYPSEEERFFSIDYSIDEELTNYLLVVDLFEDLSISYITTES